MNKHILFSATVSLVSAAALLLAPATQAMTFEQTQSFGGESTQTCTGECSMNFSFSASQHQFVSDDSEARPQLNTRYNRHHEGGKTRARAARDGQVRISWDHRGGTCQVRYTEAPLRNYKYATTAACDEGGVTIGGLVRGTTYKFQIQKEGGAWSNPVRAVAR